MIDLPDLQDLSIEEIKSLIAEEDDNVIEIYLPKTTRQFFNEPVDIAYDYAFAAYSAQELSEILTIIEYESPAATELVSYFFKVKFNDGNALAEILYEISCLYGFNDDEDGDGITIEEVNQFLYEVQNGEIIPVCPDLIEIFNEFIPAEDDDD